MQTLPKPIEIAVPSLDVGFFDFTPPPPVNEKLAKLRTLPKDNVQDLLEWTITKRKYLGPNRLFNLENHLYLKDIYRCQSKEIVLMKASQMGASEYLISYAIHVADMRNGNILYLMPTEGHVSDFSAARLGPAIEASPYLSSIVIDGGKSGGMRGSDRITLKRIRDRFLYFRGGKVAADGKAAQIKTIDADALLIDELDELDPRAPAIANKRLGHAKEDINVTLRVSTPTYPSVGIHEEWLKSDQRLWHVKCEHCGEWQSLDINMCIYEWDSLGRPYLWHGKEDATAWLACKKCGGMLDRLSEGQWIATYPERSITGFHLTKLFSAQMNLLTVVLDLDTVDDNKRREAFNQNLGIPYVPRGGHLDTETIDNCRRQYTHGPDYGVTTYLGIDVGRILHCVIRTLPDFVTGETRQLYADELTWDDLDRIIKIYRPKRIVIDALPETTKAREFQARYPKFMVWLAYYPNLPQGNKRENFTVFDAKEGKVLIDRTRSLDSMYAGFYGATSTLPYHARNIRDYYDQLRAAIRVLKEDSSGQEVARYVETGADHYSHAENYCQVASLCKIGLGWSEGMSS